MKKEFYKDVIKLYDIVDELNKIVYGGYQLIESKELDDFDAEDIIQYINENNYFIGDVFSNSDIVDYVENNMDFSDFNFYDEDIKEYIRDNFYIEDLIDIDWKY